VEVTIHERKGLNALGLPKVTHHGAVVGHIKRKTFIKENYTKRPNAWRGGCRGGWRVVCKININTIKVP
jgi:hypothetical protein